MSKAFHIIKDLLMKKIEPKEAYESISTLMNVQHDNRELAKTFSMLRLSRCLSSIEKNSGTDTIYDAAGHLRQIILMYHQKINLHEYYVKLFEPVKKDFGFTIDYSNELNCSFAFPQWLNQSKQIEKVFDLELRRMDKSRMGDGILYHATGHKNYTSKEQKALVRAGLTMKEGQTLLACLPTGGGKSLIGQLPAYFETKGGQVYGGVLSAGTTLVIVPTVALAIDQNRSSRKVFKNARNEEHLPHAYYGGLDKEKKQVIMNGLKNGTIPLLYTSPESIINGPLYQVLLDACKEGRINRLIIDEAHIVVDWGSAFRTDFQLLSVFRRKMMKASKGKLKTILLSATLTDTATSTLSKLFAEPDQFIEFRSDSLRFEPIYFLDKPNSQNLRMDRILELIPLLPRPIILYVNSIKSAIEWVNAIQQENFFSVKSFTGETLSEVREQILREWNDNELDMIVATSAFGMGVDKSDVRTVIHCGIPESINRFYQEVGRGGRDGFASISLLSVIKDDEQLQMKNSAVLTVDNMAERWEKMRSAAKDFTGDSFWVDTNTRPHHLRNNETGNKNASWNETTVLFLYRYGLVDIIDIRKRDQDDRRQLLVKMLDTDTLSHKHLLDQKIEPFRQKEREHFNWDFRKMIDIILNAKDECFSTSFQDTYPLTNETCGGCPFCHEHHISPFCFPNKSEVSMPSSNGDYLLEGILKQYLGNYKDVLFYTNESLTDEMVLSIINGLINVRVQAVAIPKGMNREDLINSMPFDTYESYAIYELEELVNDLEINLFSGPIAIVYPDNEMIGNSLYMWVMSYQRQGPGNRVIHIAPKNYVIRNENKQLQELIDGSLFNIKQILTKTFEDEEWF